MLRDENGDDRRGLTPICVDAKTAAWMLGMSPQTLANMRCRGEGPEPTRYGRHVTYSVAKLEQYADEHTKR